jgi:2-oxo-4-hydroxy-4-carboxy-5-ureidoimidazoline decarboxylase
VDLGAFNREQPGDLVARLLACAAVPTWADKLIAGRPYRDTDAVLERAASLAQSWTDDQVRRAIAAHPRIGATSPTSATPSEAAMSATEQRGVGGDADTLERLREGNLAYEQRFGTVFLIRAAGRSGDEMLAELERRLGNDPTTERDETREQLTGIALLRLRDLLRS